MRSLIGLTVLVLALASHAEAATLNKCIDAKGEVTYSNLPCHNAREVRTVEIDPAPQPDPVQAQPAQPAIVPTSKPKSPPTESAPPIRLETRRASAPPPSRASASKCDTLTNKLGQVFDKMDQARRKGYTQKQMDAWNLQVKELERKKQLSGCF
ncbi:MULTISPECIES: DUF4124 domain-containing protein [unclassified Thiobacillus]|uniref:DUF4124 domain-containing protein n=1 Tax=unclassified Thiobacillus TaxID=2646513 RepID=UPI00086E50D1|nr:MULTISPECIES: DUF4124 domain-containing protein [unclassified Thiobacillus]MBS0309816.1 DUF4124 domain-containing protein [Pseudomonadota bacterium]MBS0328749.1 DUF4124 domain-containing protein [Pseudomonadota bacterium]ODU99069.1 MAG: hypothetical protein ABT23_14435 [Thiobacillus sp. SCN 63-57]OJY55587.1 MAG: hypothetical protein BGP19_10915 [Thiobacillus sp. 0-1251]